MAERAGTAATLSESIYLGVEVFEEYYNVREIEIGVNKKRFKEPIV